MNKLSQAGAAVKLLKNRNLLRGLRFLLAGTAGYGYGKTIQELAEGHTDIPFEARGPDFWSRASQQEGVPLATAAASAALFGRPMNGVKWMLTPPALALMGISPALSGMSQRYRYLNPEKPRFSMEELMKWLGDAAVDPDKAMNRLATAGGESAGRAVGETLGKELKSPEMHDTLKRLWQQELKPYLGPASKQVGLTLGGATLGGLGSYALGNLAANVLFPKTKLPRNRSQAELDAYVEARKRRESQQAMLALLAGSLGSAGAGYTAMKYGPKLLK